MKNDIPMIRLNYDHLPIDWLATGTGVCAEVLLRLQQRAASLPFIFPRPKHAELLDAFRVQHELTEVELKCAHLNGDTPEKLEKKAQRFARAVSYLFLSRRLRLLLFSPDDFASVVGGISQQHLPLEQNVTKLDVWQSEDPKMYASIRVTTEEVAPMLAFSDGRFWPGPAYCVAYLPRAVILSKVVPSILFRIGNNDDIVQPPDLERILDLHTYTVGMG